MCNCLVLLNNMKLKEHNETVCLEVVSRICASLSHDVNNTLAIINENAGLIEDLIGMSKHEYILQSDDILPSTNSILNQVAKAKLLVANLNQLAHSNDEASTVLSLHSAINYVRDLLARLLLQNETELKIKCDQELIIKCNKLQLHSLLYLSIRRVVEGTRPERITVHGSAARNGEVKIVFDADGEMSEGMDISDIKALVEGMGGSIVCDDDFCLNVPTDES